MTQHSQTYAVKLPRRSLREQRDRYQAQLVVTVAALQQITWHIGCDQVGRGDLTLTNTNGMRVFFNEGCPACIAKKALAAIGGDLGLV